MATFSSVVLASDHPRASACPPWCSHHDTDDERYLIHNGQHVTCHVETATGSQLEVDVQPYLDLSQADRGPCIALNLGEHDELYLTAAGAQQLLELIRAAIAGAPGS